MGVPLLMSENDASTRSVLGPSRLPGGREAGGRAKSSSPRFLGLPLFYKIVVANGVIVALGAVAGTAFALSLSDETAGSTLSLVTGLLALAVVVLCIVVNAFLIHLALSPLRELEETAHRVSEGDTRARARPSPLSDFELLELTQVFNQMLDRMASRRSREREIAGRLLEAEEQERVAVARELFEEPAQSLASALVGLRLTLDGVESAQGASEVRENLREALERLKQLARRLHPPELDELGIAAAVHAYARSLHDQFAVEIDVCAPLEPGALPPSIRLPLFRILQEAMNNAVSHADPGKITVSIESHVDSWVCEIRDDGKGFDPERTMGDLSHSPGLWGMSERAGYIGSSLQVVSADGQGTLIRVEVPKRDEAGKSRSMAPA